MTHNPEEPIYFGCKFKPFTKQVRYSFGNTNLQVFGSVSKLYAGIDEFYVLMSRKAKTHKSWTRLKLT